MAGGTGCEVNQIKLVARKLDRGRYIYNERYYVEFSTGPSASGDGWRWYDSHQLDCGGEWRKSKAEAEKDLMVFLDASLEGREPQHTDDISGVRIIDIDD